MSKVAIVVLADTDTHEASAHIIHERFYCNRRYAAATSQHAASTACWRAGSPVAASTYCFKYASAPRGSACLSRSASWRFRHEPS